MDPIRTASPAVAADAQRTPPLTSVPNTMSGPPDGHPGLPTAAEVIESADRTEQDTARRVARAIAAPQRRRVEVEWHAASLGYVHRILDPSSGRQLQQFPAAQVLDMVDDLMRQIQEEQ